MEEVETAQLLASLHTTPTAGLPASRPGTTESWPAITAPIPNIISHTPKHLPAVGQEPHPQPPQHRSMQPATSSYWSVPEQTDFQNLVQHFGTDWHAIANHMKSKTHTMVSNYMSFFGRSPRLFLDGHPLMRLLMVDQKLLSSPSGAGQNSG